MLLFKIREIVITVIISQYLTHVNLLQMFHEFHRGDKEKEEENDIACVCSCSRAVRTSSTCEGSRP